MTSLHYQLAILRAEAEGFHHFAAALRALYLLEYPIIVRPESVEIKRRRQET